MIRTSFWTWAPVHWSDYTYEGKALFSVMLSPRTFCMFSKGRFTHNMPRPCRAAKGLECVFPISFTQCGRVWFTHAMLWPCRSSQGHGMVRAWHGHGIASVNQTRSHCVNQMGKTHSKPLAARHGRGTAWARHGHGMLCVNRPLIRVFAGLLLHRVMSSATLSVCTALDWR